MYSKDEVWDKLPSTVQETINKKNAKMYVINASEIAERIGLGPRINVILQTAFFKISNIIDFNEAVNAIKNTIKKTYGRYGEKIVNMNIQAVDDAINELYTVTVTEKVTSNIPMNKCSIPVDADEFIKETVCKMIQTKVMMYLYHTYQLMVPSQREPQNTKKEILH